MTVSFSRSKIGSCFLLIDLSGLDLWLKICLLNKKYKKIVYFGNCAEKAENNWPRRYGVPQKPPGALFGRICKIEGRKNPPISLQRTSATQTRNLHHRLNSRAPSDLDENHEMNYLDIITILHNSIKRQFSWFWPINQFFQC